MTPQAHTTDAKDRSGQMFVIPGMPRCGTTFLYHNLRKHPYLFLAFMKESNYFSVNHGRGKAWFQSLFEDRKPYQLAGDISPYYFLDEASVDRIASFDSKVKLIVGLRRPSEVALSLYTQMSVTEKMPSFEEFARSYRFPVGDDHLEVSLESGLFSRMLGALRERFGDQVLIYSFEAFRADRLAVMRAIERFLEVPPFFEEGNFEDAVINAGNRRTIKALELLLRNKAFIYVVEHGIPRKLLDVMRDRYERFRRARGGSNPSTYTGENRERTVQIFAADDAAYEDLFAEAQLVLGTGEAFPTPSD